MAAPGTQTSDCMRLDRPRTACCAHSLDHASWLTLRLSSWLPEARGISFPYKTARCCGTFADERSLTPVWVWLSTRPGVSSAPIPAVPFRLRDPHEFLVAARQ